ncbi:lipopolysaccharide heptosyltransferase I [Helicobacter cynogastricus]|uniref:lipopolysaccharide heptosyltransferase I n=1 Tax=Helicobacter cynogastricus TaxID=329937 RepID=UPI000CF09E17|nr:lipopolysaccharide heptosyltransferase I [Helicobacter cynogastricus]
MKVGIIRLSAMGDVVVSAVFLPFLKQRYPSVQIHWFVDSLFAPLLQYSPYIDKLHILSYKQTLRTKNPLKIWRFFRTLREIENLDVLIDMQGLLKSAFLGAWLSKKAFVGFDRSSIREPLASFFYNHKVTIPYSTHILKRNQAVLEKGFSMLGACKWEDCLEQRHKAFHLPLCPSLRKLDNPHSKILFVLEASKPNKIYPWESFAQVGQALQNVGLEIVLLWHAQPDHAKALYRALKPYIPTTLLPPLQLDSVKTLVSRMHAVVGGDTGIVHLAWALQIPSVTLYGNTPKERFELKGKDHIALVGNAQANYSKKDFSIQNISPKQVAQAILQVLGGVK